jgi:hypothetical protein
MGFKVSKFQGFKVVRWSRTKVPCNLETLLSQACLQVSVDVAGCARLFEMSEEQTA